MGFASSGLFSNASPCSAGVPDDLLFQAFDSGDRPRNQVNTAVNGVLTCTVGHHRKYERRNVYEQLLRDLHKFDRFDHRPVTTIAVVGAANNHLLGSWKLIPGTLLSTGCRRVDSAHFLSKSHPRPAYTRSRGTYILSEMLKTCLPSMHALIGTKNGLM